MDLPDPSDTCVRLPSGKIFCSECCRDRFLNGETPLTPSNMVQEYSEKQDKRMNSDLLLHQIYMEKT
eukprot:7149298-Karenia_brevis.AAC.1